MLQHEGFTDSVHTWDPLVREGIMRDDPWSYVGNRGQGRLDYAAIK
jgi:hypothetical protein